MHPLRKLDLALAAIVGTLIAILVALAAGDGETKESRHVKELEAKRCAWLFSEAETKSDTAEVIFRTSCLPLAPVPVKP